MIIGILVSEITAFILAQFGAIDFFVRLIPGIFSGNKGELMYYLFFAAIGVILGFLRSRD